MNSNDLSLLIQKFLAGNCTDEEKQFLIQWYTNLPSKEAGDMDQIGKMIWKELRENAIVRPVEKRSKIVHFYTPLKVAASVALLIGLAVVIYFFRGNVNTLENVADSSASVSRILFFTVVRLAEMFQLKFFDFIGVPVICTSRPLFWVEPVPTKPLV